MNPRPRTKVGGLEILCSAAAACLAVGSFLDLWPFNLPIALLFLVLLYAVLRDVRSLNESKRRVPGQPNSRNAHAEQTVRAPR
jgi:hypothetical protein